MCKSEACRILRTTHFNTETKLLVLMSHGHCIFFILAQCAKRWFWYNRVQVLKSLQMEQTCRLFKGLQKTLLQNLLCFKHKTQIAFQYHTSEVIK